MSHTANKRLTPYAQKLRREMTKEERHLWYDFLKSLPISFRRQKVIGDYIVDFYCPEAKLVIELDGGQHYLDESRAADLARDRALAEKGLTVLRYSNEEIQHNFTGVCEDVLRHLP